MTKVTILRMFVEEYPSWLEADSLDYSESYSSYSGITLPNVLS